MASRGSQKAQKRCAVYVRVSTREQRPRSQLRELTQYARRKGYQLPYRPFVDIESAGKPRPSLEKLRGLVRRRKVDVVLVWKFDRFARSLQELINSLEEFRELGIDFESYTQQIDTTTSHGKAWFGMVSVFAEFERDLIRERTIAGLDRARADGVQLGRPPLDEAKIAEIRRLKRQGVSVRSIAIQVGVSVGGVIKYATSRSRGNKRQR